MIKLLSHLSHLGIATPDVEGSARFYEEQVGVCGSTPTTTARCTCARGATTTSTAS